MTIKVTYNVTDVYVTQDVSPVYINVSYSTGSSGGSAVWGGITGTLSDQTDLQTALDAKVPYSGATANVDLGEYELKAGQVEFDQTPTGTAGVGVMRWNDSDGTLDLGLKGGNVTLQLGQEQVARVVNKSGVNLLESAYQVVKVTDAQGQRLAVDLAQGNNDANSTDTIGIVTENIDNNQEGFITTSGIVRNINTTGSLQGETWNDGDVLYLSPTTAGAITNVKPTAPNHTVILGYVVYAHAVNGKIFVKCDNGYELGELHDVYVPTPSNNDGIFWNSTNLRYENKSISSALGYTPANSATTLTINGVTYDLSTSRTWTISAGISGSGASGQVAYWTGTSAQSGSNNLFWDATNSRLGIGTNAPAEKLHVAGNATYRGLYPYFELVPSGWSGGMFYLQAGVNDNGSTAGNYTVFFNSQTTRGFSWVQNSSPRMALTPSNNLIIQNGGTFTDSGERLQVTGTMKVTGASTFGGILSVSVSSGFIAQSFKSQYTAVGYLGGDNTAAWVGTGADGLVNSILCGTSTNFIGFRVNSTERFRIHSSGNVSIGNTNDTYKLDVSGSIRCSSGGILFTTTSTGADAFYTLVSNNIRFYVSSNGYAKSTSSLISDVNGAGTINASAVLQADSTTKGFLPPRMTTTEKNAISSPAAGLVVYDTTLAKLCVYTTAWETITSS